jgi:DNA polymerase (family X)
MSALDAAAVAALLVELGRRTALAGDNHFRAKAYQRAADTLSALAEPLDRVIAEDRLRQVPGIGETIADIVTKLHNTGTHPLLDKLRREVPEAAPAKARGSEPRRRVPGSQASSPSDPPQ